MTPTPRVECCTKSMSLKHEPTTEPLPISVKYLFSNWDSPSESVSALQSWQEWHGKSTRELSNKSELGKKSTCPPSFNLLLSRREIDTICTPNTAARTVSTPRKPPLKPSAYQFPTKYLYPPACFGDPLAFLRSGWRTVPKLMNYAQVDILGVSNNHTNVVV